MQKLSLLLVVFLSSFTLYAQDITGQWNGILKVQGTQLRLVFHITTKDTGLTSTMDSPDQGAKGIPVTSTSFENSKLKFAIKNAGIEYEGVLENDSNVVGTFKQAGQAFPMNLSRKEVKKEIVIRPQEPVKPYPYYSEEVNFENKTAGITLAGTLTLPSKEGVFPVVVLITGSGPQNRDEELMGHKPFLVLSDYLSRNGIAVLRFDDRGTASSKGDFKTATSADFATDVESAIKFLQTRKEINKKKIGLIGHSEGGLIAPMVASKSDEVAFLVLLAGTGIPGDQLLLLQQQLIGKASGTSDADLQELHSINKGAFDIVLKSANTEELKTELASYIRQTITGKKSFKTPQGVSEENYIRFLINQVATPWMQYYIKYDPAIALEKVKCPVLAINGEKDLQVPAKENLEAIKRALLKGGNKNVVTKQFPNLNHLFQEATTGSPEEYYKIEQTFSPLALAEILKFIKTQTKQ